MVSRVLALLASVMVLAAAYDEIGFAQTVGDVSKGCLGLQSTFMRNGTTVVFDLGNGTYDATTGTANMTYTEAGRSGSLKNETGGITYMVTSNGTTCTYTLEVMAGSFLGKQGPSKVDSAGVVQATYDQARSDASFACNQAPAGPLVLVTSGNFAAVGGRVGSYDPTTKKATFVTAFDAIFTVAPSADGKSLTADLQRNDAKTKCGYNVKVVDGNVLGVAASA